MAETYYFMIIINPLYKIFFLIILFSVSNARAQKETLLKIDGKVVEFEKDKDLKVYQEFYDSGKVKISGFKKNGKFEGLFIYYDKKGKILYKILYKKNRILYTDFVGHKNGFTRNLILDSVRRE